MVRTNLDRKKISFFLRFKSTKIGYLSLKNTFINKQPKDKENS